MQKTERLTIRLTKNQLNHIEKIANKMNMNIAETARMLMLSNMTIDEYKQGELKQNDNQ